ncbi:hypothetical protein BD809_104216 [Aquimarina intermedia]|uniref:DUF2314 domain-containing protein n=2 Tax=Aquimarina intermedia TaxID=350814 RepID=A0A5S5C7N2_9FLAO|nr:hypothetical protein BD809_104216 [Aquimarina intermedia]
MRKEDKYFGKKLPLTKRENKILENYKAVYVEIAFDARLPTFEKDKFELVDIAKTATEIIYDHPIPTKQEKERVGTKRFVKLKFLDKNFDVERIWVEITERDGKLFKGMLRNESLSNDALQSEKEFWFHSNHIFQIRNK